MQKVATTYFGWTPQVFEKSRLYDYLLSLKGFEEKNSPKSQSLLSDKDVSELKELLKD